MEDIIKRIIATIVLFAFCWMAFCFNEYVIWGQVYFYDTGRDLLKGLGLLMLVLIIFVVFQILWFKVLRLSYDLIPEYVTPPITFYLLDVVALFIFLQLDKQWAGVGEGLYWAYGKHEVYCLFIGFIYLVFYIGGLAIKEVRERKRK